MKKLFLPKNVLWLVALASLFAFLGSLFAQFGLGKTPCNLCILQRMLVVSTGITAFVLALVLTVWKKAGKGSKTFINILASLPIIAGAGVALKQVYIQTLPPDLIPACGSPLEFMMKTMPLTDVLQTVLAGSSDCAKVETLMWLPIPWWSATFFIGSLIFLWASWLIIGRKS